MKISSNQKQGEAVDEQSLIIASRVAFPFTIPIIGIACRMRLVSRSEALQITIAARAAMIDAGMSIDAVGMASIGTLSEYRSEEICRIMAVAVLHKTKDEPIASLDEWRECSDEQLAICWRAYNDISAVADPLANGEVLQADEFTLLDAAAKKKDLPTLISYGSRSLAIYAATLASQASMSPIPS
jgi:hypothetical protein